jgi:tRNA (cmo5U34)-methyltransferase
MFVKPNSAIYDIGCSTGTTIQLLAQKLSTIPGIRFVGVDGSPDMIQKAKKKLGKSGHLDKCEFVTADINSSFAITDPSVVLLILTLQFSRPLYRDAFVKRIHDSLQEGCCLILIEKVLCDNSFLNRVFIDLYYEFKKRMGYSELEISQKRESLENILIPYRESENMELLRRNGFRHIETFFRWYNFSGILAVK